MNLISFFAIFSLIFFTQAYATESFDIMELEDFLHSKNITLKYRTNFESNNSTINVHTLIYKALDTLPLGIVGQIQNNINQSIKVETIGFTFYDNTGRIVGLSETSPFYLLSYLKPGDVVPFKHDIGNDISDSQIEKASLLEITIFIDEKFQKDLKYSDSIYSKDKKLNATVDGVYTDDGWGDYRILGKIKNTGSATTDFLHIQPVYYNSKDQVVNWYTGGSDTILNRELSPEDVTPFEVTIHPLYYSDVAYVSLYVVSMEYSLIGNKSLDVTLNIPIRDR